MAELEVIDYSNIALSLLIEEFRNSIQFQKVLGITTKIEMDMQTAVFEIQDRFILSTATGYELTILGFVWNAKRRLDITETDDEYRDKVKIKATLTMSGTLPEIKKILIYFYGGTYATYTSVYPAGFNLATDAIITQAEFDKLLAAGVDGILI